VFTSPDRNGDFQKARVGDTLIFEKLRVFKKLIPRKIFISVALDFVSPRKSFQGLFVKKFMPSKRPPIENFASVKKFMLSKRALSFRTILKFCGEKAKPDEFLRKKERESIPVSSNNTKLYFQICVRLNSESTESIDDSLCSIPDNWVEGKRAN
jgi:hypothetical protein